MNYLTKCGYFLLVAIATCTYTTVSAQRHHGNRGGYEHHDKHNNNHGGHRDRGHYKVVKKRGHQDRWSHARPARKVVYRGGRSHYNAPRAYRGGGPYWASRHHYQSRHHVYFRDYCTFYDPYRGGYVYWSNRRWIFSPSVPAFLANVDLNTARIQVMADIPLSRHPEYYYDNYAQAYPRNGSISIGINLPL